MKKLLYILLFFSIGCEDYQIPETFDISVTVTYPANFNIEGQMRNAEVTLINKQSGRQYSSISNEAGLADFNVRGGIYDIIASATENHMIEENGSEVSKAIVFSASLHNEQILQNPVHLNLETGYSVLQSGFVIKELCTSGSTTPEGATYAGDKFVEIYNNSEQILYSDGLCFGVVHPTITSRPTPFVDADGNLLTKIPCWSYIATIPGSGFDYPVLPGQSILLSLSGINHKNDPNGNPNSIDLSMADWEFYVEDGKYLDNPGVKNLLMTLVYKGTTISLSTKGQVCILFRVPSQDRFLEFNNPDNYMVEPGGRERCFMVPKEWVIDGVENSWPGDIVYKRLPDVIDIGYIQKEGSYNSKSIKRKVKEVINGRTIYQDTNNSTNDFLTNQEPTPGVIATN